MNCFLDHSLLGCVKIYPCIYKMINESALKTIQFRCNLSLWDDQATCPPSLLCYENFEHVNGL